MAKEMEIMQRPVDLIIHLVIDFYVLRISMQKEIPKLKILPKKNVI